MKTVLSVITVSFIVLCLFLAFAPNVHASDSAWYAGAVYPSSTVQYASGVSMTMTLPSSLPESNAFYTVLLSTWDSAGSYVQLGFSDNYGVWGLTYSWTTGPPNALVYYSSPQAMALSAGFTYRFDITTQNGVTTFGVFHNDIPIWTLDAPTGGNFLILSNAYMGGSGFTVYEEIHLGYVPAGVPAFNFNFTNTYWMGSSGYNVASWVPLLNGAVPDSVAGPVVNGNSVFVNNHYVAPTQWMLTVSSAHDSPSPSVGSHVFADGSSVSCSVASQVSEGGTVWKCTGWSGSGSVPSSGAGSSVTFTISQDSTITWNWVSVPKPSINSFTVSVNPFSPNGDGTKDTTTITASFNVNVGWNLQATNKYGTVVRIWTGTGTSLSLVWYGTNSSGYRVADGTYNLTLTGKDSVGNMVSKTIQVVVDTKPTTVSSVYVSPYSFSPRYGQTTKFYYTLSESCYVTVKIYNSAGTLVRTLLSSSLQSGGARSITWNGKYSSGATVPTGTYTIKLYVVDKAGNKASPYPITKTVKVT